MADAYWAAGALAALAMLAIAVRVGRPSPSATATRRDKAVGQAEVARAAQEGSMGGHPATGDILRRDWDENGEEATGTEVEVPSPDPTFYAPILRRYLAVLADGVLVLSAFVTIGFAMRGIEEGVLPVLRGTVGLFLFLVYEPLFTSRWCTVGQWLTGVRVRSDPSLERISLPVAYVRLLVKWLLGFISFLTIPFHRKRQGLHDMVTRTVVLRADRLTHAQLAAAAGVGSATPSRAPTPGSS